MCFSPFTNYIYLLTYFGPTARVWMLLIIRFGVRCKNKFIARRYRMSTICGNVWSEHSSRAGFQQNMLDEAVDQGRKRMVACILAEGHHFKIQTVAVMGLLWFYSSLYWCWVWHFWTSPWLKTANVGHIGRTSAGLWRFLHCWTIIEIWISRQFCW